jgi:hypothetical protein
MNFINRIVNLKLSLKEVIALSTLVGIFLGALL